MIRDTKQQMESVTSAAHEATLLSPTHRLSIWGLRGDGGASPMLTGCSPGSLSGPESCLKLCRSLLKLPDRRPQLPCEGV